MRFCRWAARRPRYRRNCVDYSQQNNGRQSGLNAILHGPVTGSAWQF